MNPAVRATLLPLTALLLGVGILFLGNGLQGTLLSVRGTAEAFGPGTIGVITGAYFAGFIAGSLLGTRVIDRVGHIRAFAAFAAVASSAALLHVLWVDPVAWAAVRAASGFCFAGLYMTIESWLNERADNQTRGQVLSAYMIVNLCGLSLGQFLLMAGDPADFHLFAIVAVLISLALVPVALTRTQAPLPSPVQLIPLSHLFAISPLGVVGCIATGIGTGAFWGLAPVFAEQLWQDSVRTAIFMGITVAGGLILQWPIGWVSDRFDRRRVITGICFLLALSALAVVLGARLAPGILLPMSALFGGLLFPLYSLAVAHVNDNADRADLVAVSGALLLLYGVGAVVGPVAAGHLMRVAGPDGLYYFFSAVFAGVGAYALYRIRKRPPIPPEQREAFVVVSRTTPVALALDPRLPAEDADAPDGYAGDGPAPDQTAATLARDAQREEDRR